MDSSNNELPPSLVCPVCRKLFTNPVTLPCCSVTACRVCSLQKLLVS